MVNILSKLPISSFYVMPSQEYWEQVYSSKAIDQVSWFQEHADQSLRLIQETGVPHAASIIDVGGGASTLVDDLLFHNYTEITVLDLSSVAIAAAQQRLGFEHRAVNWLVADITKVQLPVQHYDVWHDRAVFHFLTSPEQRQAYVAAVLRSVKPGGYVIVATFAEDGPSQCSGLPVIRYSANGLHAEFGAPFSLLKHEKEEHLTPFGTKQKFIYCYCRKI